MAFASVRAADEPQTWQVPVAGNAYLTASAAGSPDSVQVNVGTRWQDPASVFSLFFRIDRPAALDLALRLRAPDGPATIKATVGKQIFQVEATSAEITEIPLGRVQVSPGYLRVDLQGVSKTGKSFPEVTELVAKSATPGVKTAFVRNNDGNQFYWGRRGPSIHLGYKLPQNVQVQYAYTEVTVPQGQDPIGSYFMANGFGEGYFGMQVKSPTERWILFSVWSPHATNRPGDIPADMRVELLKKGPDVQAGEFGGEGAGGQSRRVFPWQAGVTYRFLNSVKPDGQGNTVYSAWFGEVGKPDWQLMASFKRPKTNTHLTGYHSFLENFADTKGYLGRGALYANQWVCDTDGKWHEITEAYFTGDGTASSGSRLDFAGGVSGKSFFMRNGGYFAEQVPIDQAFKRPATPERQPKIDFGKLEQP